MIRVAIIGGKLQGVEAAYLAGRAGWQTLLIDKNAGTPASGLCDECVQADIRIRPVVKSLLRGVDLVIPALENREALAVLEELVDEIGCPIAFDFPANAISCSKTRSHGLFAELGLYMPQPYSECGFPLLVKPDASSGSRGVAVLENEEAYARFFGEQSGCAVTEKGGAAQPNLMSQPEGWVVQQFLDGPSYSLEVIGRDGRYSTPQITELHMDEGFDCKAVTAPATDLTPALADELRRISLAIAQRLELNGIMDVEVILHDDRLYLLEIDARLPSQTPIAVYRSSGMNMLESLAGAFGMSAENRRPRLLQPQQEKWVRLEHIKVDAGVMTLAGEHLMAGAGPLHISEDFFGSCEAITDYRPGKQNWCATLVHIGASFADLQARRMVSLAAIREACNILEMIDSVPNTTPDSGAHSHDAVEIY